LFREVLITMRQLKPALVSVFTTGSLMALASLGASAQAADNLVKNGGFEVNGGQGFVQWTGTPNPQVNVTTLADWINNHNIPAGSWGFNVITSVPYLQSTNYYYPGFWGVTPGYQNGNGFTASPNGGWFIASDGFDYRSPLEQTISDLEVGSTYTLSFNYAHAQEANVNGDTHQHWEVSFGSEGFSTPDVLLPSHGFRGWYTATNEFTATSTSQILSFLAFGTNGLPPYLLLDGVSLTKNSVPVPPAPGPLPMIGLAAAYGWSSKLRRRIQASVGQRAAVFRHS
jgi:hypothetical protein